MHSMDCTKTLRLRIKDKHACVLAVMARQVNQVFNFCNQTSHRAIRERPTSGSVATTCKS
jgi:hypothetical protein